MQIDNILEERNRVIEEQTAMWDLADTENRSLDAAELEREATMNERIATLDQRLTLVATRAAAENEALRVRSQMPEVEGGHPDGTLGGDLGGDGTPSTVDEAERLALRSLARGDIQTTHLGYRPANERAQSLADTEGGELVPTLMHDEIHRLMVEESPILMLARVIRTAGGAPMTFPKVTSYQEAQQVALGAAIPGQDIATGEITLAAWKYGFISSVPRELEADSAFGVESFITETGGQALGRGVDAKFIAGTGNGEPEGVINAPTGVTTAATAAVSMDELISAQHSVLSSQRGRGSFIVHDSTLAAIRKLKDGNGNYIWQRSTQAGQPDMLLDNSIYADPNMPVMASGATFGIFGDLSGFYVRISQGITVERSAHAQFANDYVAYKFITRVDSAIQDTTGIRALVNA